MSKRLHVFIRFAIFGLVACLLVWLGTAKPKVAASGPGVIVIGQGSNANFQLQNAQSGFWLVRSANGLSNVSTGVSNAAGK